MSTPPSPRKIYTDLLLSKVLGYPLYYPEPYRNALRRGWTGVSIGDVGIINSDGGFDFQFNVVKRPNILPDPNSDVLASVANGMPLHPELSFHDRLPQFHAIILQESEIRYNDNDCHPGKVIGRYITHTISLDGQILMHTPPSPIRAGLTFNIECSHEKAASLILPNGATRMDVVDEQLGQFYNLARRHGASWLGLFPFTGPSLCLVTGCVKTSGWALMSLYGSSRTGGLSLKFGVGAGPSWTWLEAGPADTRHSPETDDPNRNHCVFLRGIRISKRNRKWPFRRKGIDVDVLGRSGRYPFNTEGSGSTSGSTTRTHLDPTSIGGSTSNYGSQRSAGQAASEEDEENTSTDDQSDEDIIIEPLTEVPISNHPSEIINQRLLHENPSAEFAVTHDDQWANVLREIDTPLDEEGLWLRMLEKHNVIVESNCVFFEDKGTPGSVLESQDPITQFGRLPHSQELVNDPHGLITNLVHLVDDYKSVGTIAANMPVVLSGLLSGGTRVQHDALRILESSARSFYGELNNATAGAIPALVDCIISSDEAATRRAALDGLEVIVKAHKNIINRALFGTLPSLVRVLSGVDTFQIRGLEILKVITGSPHCTLVVAILPDVVQCLSSYTSVQVDALKVIEVGARSEGDQLAEAVATILPQVILQLSSDDSRVQLAALKVLEAAAGSKNDKLAEAVAPILPQVVVQLSSSDVDVQYIALKVLQNAAESKNDKLAEAVAPTLPQVIVQLSSNDSRIQLAALKVLETAAGSKLAKAVAPTLPQIIMQLSSNDSRIQLATLKVLETAAGSMNDKLAEAVVPILPQVIEQLSSNDSCIQLATLKVIESAAGSKNDKLAEAVAPTLPQIIVQLSSNDSRIQLAALKVLEATAGSKNEKLAEAVALKLTFIEKFFSGDIPRQLAALRVLEASARSENEKLIEAVAVTVTSRFMLFMNQLSSRNNGVQLAALTILKIFVGSNNDKLVKLVVTALPHLEKLHSSRGKNMEIVQVIISECQTWSGVDRTSLLDRDDSYRNR